MDRDPIERARALHPLEQVIGAVFPLYGQGRFLKARAHDSLVVDTRHQRFYWNSRGISGDVFDWIGYATFGQLYDKHRHFREVLARVVSGRVGTACAAHDAPIASEPLALDERLALVYHRSLTAAARSYWRRELTAPDDAATADRAMEQYLLGYCPRHRLWRQATYTIPVYEEGRLVDVRHRLARPPNPSGRYRPEVRGAGAHLFNGYLLPAAREVVLVAGEKKAIALTVRGIPAVSSTAGCLHLPDAWLPRFDRCERIAIAFDPGEDAAAAIVAARFDGRARVVCLPTKPDDFFVQGGTVARFRKLLGT